MGRRFCSLLFTVFVGYLLIDVPTAHATLKWYYNPLTGNVSFDSCDTRSGGLYTYAFEIYASPPAFTFRTENLLRLTTSTFFTDLTNSIGEGSFSTSLSGLYTLGDILPAGLSEHVWTTTFTYTLENHNNHELYSYNYSDVVGGGQPPKAQFIYGAPSGEFKNKWDLVNPDTLKWAKTATLVYQPWNGKVLVDTTGSTSGYITGILLQSNGQLLAGGFAPDITGPFNTASPKLMSIFADAIEPGVYNIGTILEGGLTLAEFEAKFTSAQFLPAPGSKAKVSTLPQAEYRCHMSWRRFLNRTLCTSYGAQSRSVFSHSRIAVVD